MLDVHPPHHAAHTWRDLFIHIANHLRHRFGAGCEAL